MDRARARREARRVGSSATTTRCRRRRRPRCATVDVFFTKKTSSKSPVTARVVTTVTFTSRSNNRISVSHDGLGTQMRRRTWARTAPATPRETVALETFSANSLSDALGACAFADLRTRAETDAHRSARGSRRSRDRPIARLEDPPFTPSIPSRASSAARDRSRHFPSPSRSQISRAIAIDDAAPTPPSRDRPPRYARSLASVASSTTRTAWPTWPGPRTRCSRKRRSARWTPCRSPCERRARKCRRRPRPRARCRRITRRTRGRVKFFTSSLVL